MFSRAAVTAGCRRSKVSISQTHAAQCNPSTTACRLDVPSSALAVTAGARSTGERSSGRNGRSAGSVTRRR